MKNRSFKGKKENKMANESGKSTFIMNTEKENY
jgi:hypothetical protein